MFKQLRLVRLALSLIVIAVASGSAASAQESWIIAKLTGEAWVTTSGNQTILATEGAALKSGYAIRTSQTGRALLTRDKDSVMVSPNTIVAVPGEKKEKPGFTKIIQRAGSILLDIEKKDVPHFEVETPYLAAVVKGTQFAVSIDEAQTGVSVTQGLVEVFDFKSGQHALVAKDQSARISPHGQTGLSLSGAGELGPILQGDPRRTTIAPVPVPKTGFAAPAGFVKTRIASADNPDATVGMGGAHGSRAAWLSWFGLSRASDADPAESANDDDLILAASIPLSIGLIVAIMIGIRRRWNNNPATKTL